jgi:nucleotide-binding universal stress UspA family protein
MKVLIPLDESEESRQIAALVAPMAKAFSATVTLFTAIEPVSDPPIQRTASESSADIVGVVGLTSPDLEIAEPQQSAWAESRDQIVAGAEDEAKDYLAPVADSLREAGVSTTVHVIMAEDVAQAIIGLAQREQVDIIAMTAHRRTGLRAVIQSSVAEAVVRAGIVPVLVLHLRTKED